MENNSKVETSKDFEEFLDFLGDRVKLDGWRGFRGGLDVRSTFYDLKSNFT